MDNRSRKRNTCGFLASTGAELVNHNIYSCRKLGDFGVANLFMKMFLCTCIISTEIYIEV